MKYILDTDTVSYLVRKNPFIIKKLKKCENDEICISVITYAEICYGLEKRASKKLTSEVNEILRKLTIIDFNHSQSELYGKIRAKIEKSGEPLGNMDILIAAAALQDGAILVTHNIKHFKKIDGIKVEDWSC